MSGRKHIYGIVIKKGPASDGRLQIDLDSEHVLLFPKSQKRQCGWIREGDSILVDLSSWEKQYPTARVIVDQGELGIKTLSMSDSEGNGIEFPVDTVLHDSDLIRIVLSEAEVLKVTHKRDPNVTVDVWATEHDPPRSLSVAWGEEALGIHAVDTGPILRIIPNKM